MRFCIVCKQEIDPERAENDEETMLCVEHAEEILEFGGEFKMSAKQERTSKKTSLKVNYGGITTSFQRNLEGLNKLLEKHGRPPFGP